MHANQGERITVPLRQLKFGHEAPVHPSNVRVTGRLDGVEVLAANIFARGLIEDLVVFDDGVPDTLFVSDGNRCLAALRMVYGDQSSEEIGCKLRPAKEAFEDSLAVAVLAHSLHPVDEFEGYAWLVKERGKTHEEIALQYGKTKKQVDQAMAIADLAPVVREAWRRREIKAEVAKAFSLAPDHATQEKVFAKLAERQAENTRGLADLDDHNVKDELKVDGDAGVLVEFVGIDAYVARGGKVTPDLFGTDHKVSDAKLAKKMVEEKLAQACEDLKKDGWSFALVSPRNSWDYSTIKVDPKPTPEEATRTSELEALFAGVVEDDIPFDDWTPVQQAAHREWIEIDKAITLRPYTPAIKAKSGCFVERDRRGHLKIEYGKVKPAQKAEAAKVVKEEKKEQTKASAKTAKEEGRPAPQAPTVLSNALKQRLETTLVAATRDAIAGEPLLVSLPLFDILARVVCAQITVDRAWGTPDAIRTKLPKIRETLNPDVFNVALAKRFDAEDYFSGAPKGIVIKAIAEAINPDEARKASTNKTKADIWKFALSNVVKTGWLPKEMRTVHYAGPGSEGFKKPVSLATAMGDALAAASAAKGKVAPVKAAATDRKKKPPAKTAATPKKAAKKAAAKKRKAA